MIILGIILLVIGFIAKICQRRRCVA
jgi:hypothetical protein